MKYKERQRIPHSEQFNNLIKQNSRNEGNIDNPSTNTQPPYIPGICTSITSGGVTLVIRYNFRRFKI